MNAERRRSEYGEAMEENDHDGDSASSTSDTHKHQAKKGKRNEFVYSFCL